MGRLRERSRLIVPLVAAIVFGGACTTATPTASPSPTAPASAAATDTPIVTAEPTTGSTARPTASQTPALTAGPSLEPLPSLPLPTGWKSVEVAGIESAALLAQTADRLYLAGMDAVRNTALFSSPDGLAWTQVPAQGIEKDFVPRSMIADAQAGLLLVGELTTADKVVPEIWRSTDGGATFTKATIETPAGSGEIVGVVLADTQLLAFGDHNVVSTDKTVGEQQGLDVWRSNDAVSWTHESVPGSDGYMARSMTHWSGGIAVLGTDGGHSKQGIWVWTAAAGWKKTADLPTASTGPILGFNERLVLLGYDAVQNVGPVPAAWWSSDGRTWTKAVAPIKGIGVMFDGGFVAGDRIVAYGMSHVGGGGTEPTPAAPGVSSSPAPPTPVPSFDIVGPTFWVSTSGGLTWQRAGSAPYYAPYQTSIATIHGHIVFATAALHRAIVSVGDIP